MFAIVCQLWSCVVELTSGHAVRLVRRVLGSAFETHTQNTYSSLRRGLAASGSCDSIASEAAIFPEGQFMSVLSAERRALFQHTMCAPGQHHL